MKVLSLNVGLPRLVLNNGEPVSTGIFKEPVTGPVRLRRLNLDGDRQADLSVHGGVDKAVYAYPAEHYDYWKTALPELDLPWGMFGENLTTTGMSETGLNVGDQFRIGSAILMITQPRLPCFKLGIKFGRADIIKKFLVSERTGFYFEVLQEGSVSAGDDIELIQKQDHSVTIKEVTRLYGPEKQNIKLMRRAVNAEALPESWRNYFQKKLQTLTGRAD